MEEQGAAQRGSSRSGQLSRFTNIGQVPLKLGQNKRVCADIHDPKCQRHAVVGAAKEGISKCEQTQTNADKR